MDSPTICAIVLVVLARTFVKHASCLAVTVNDVECVYEYVEYDGDVVSGNFVVIDHEIFWGSDHPGINFEVSFFFLIFCCYCCNLNDFLITTWIDRPGFGNLRLVNFLEDEINPMILWSIKKSSGMLLLGEFYDLYICQVFCRSWLMLVAN